MLMIKRIEIVEVAGFWRLFRSLLKVGVGRFEMELEEVQERSGSVDAGNDGDN